MICSRKTAACRAISSAVVAQIWSSTSRGISPDAARTATPGGDPALEAGHPDHEELVEVAGEDRQEADPLQQRQRRVLGQLEHPLVEAQPGQLAVEEPVGSASSRSTSAPRARTAARRRRSRCRPRAARSPAHRGRRRPRWSDAGVGLVGHGRSLPLPGERRVTVRSRSTRFSPVTGALETRASPLRCGAVLRPAGRRCSRRLVGAPVVVDGAPLALDVADRAVAAAGQPASRPSRRCRSAEAPRRARPAGRGWLGRRSRSARCATSASTAPTARSRPGSTCRARVRGRAAAAGVLPRRRVHLRRPRHPRRDLPVPGRAGRRPGALGRLPARAGAPAPGRSATTARRRTAGWSSTPTSSAPTRRASASAGDSAGGYLAATDGAAGRRGRACRAPSSC